MILTRIPVLRLSVLRALQVEALRQMHARMSSFAARRDMEPVQGGGIGGGPSWRAEGRGTTRAWSDAELKAYRARQKADEATLRLEAAVEEVAVRQRLANALAVQKEEEELRARMDLLLTGEEEEETVRAETAREEAVREEVAREEAAGEEAAREEAAGEEVARGEVAVRVQAAAVAREAAAEAEAKKEERLPSLRGLAGLAEELEAEAVELEKKASGEAYWRHAGRKEAKQVELQIAEMESLIQSKLAKAAELRDTSAKEAEAEAYRKALTTSPACAEGQCEV